MLFLSAPLYSITKVELVIELRLIANEKDERKREPDNAAGYRAVPNLMAM